VFNVHVVVGSTDPEYSTQRDAATPHTLERSASWTRAVG